MKRRMRSRQGFTLLEVMMATAVLAVGTISVLMVFGTALSFAHRRQGQQQLTQVLAEARTDARSLVNSYRPGKASAAAPKSGSKGGAPSASAQATPAGQTADTAPKASTVFSAYTYSLHFDPVRRDAPETGWRATVTVKWGDGQEYQQALVLVPDVIPDEEFGYSMTYEDERLGKDGREVKEVK